MRYTIPLSYNAIDITRLSGVISRYAGTDHNQIINDFEKEICRITGSPHAVAVSSGTAAIHLALRVLNVGPGDYVIAPSFTYVATVNPILYLGAVPVFIDSEEETWNMDPALLDKALSELTTAGKRVKAIIVVHTYGMPAKMDDILFVAGRLGIPVIEDAAESLGSTYHGKMTGILSSLGIFSFNTNKIATTFGGGALVTKNKLWADRIRFMASQSRENEFHYEHKEVGYNYQMGPLNAAYGLSSFEELETNVERRRDIFYNYKLAFGNTVVSINEPPGVRSNRWLSVFRFSDTETRSKVVQNLLEPGIETRLCWKPMHLQPVFKQAPACLNGVSEALFQSGLCLPSGSILPVTGLNEIIRIVRNTINI